ncbi:MAG: hypothetical protein JO363_07870, partial [Solirubrobacterales bacterium]|nr:hypothetical protein [Solirubrobacterales bacterium]
MPWLAVEQFEYQRRRRHSAMLQLLASVDRELCVPADASLVVENDAFRGAYAASASKIAPPRASARLIDSPSALLWQVEFAVSLEVVEYSQAVFSLIAEGRAPIALPAPYLFSADACRVRLTSSRVRRHLVALAAGLGVVTASGPAVGVAAGAMLKRPAPHTTAMIRPHKMAMINPVMLGSVKSTRSTPGLKARPVRHAKRVPASSHNTVSSLQCNPPLHLVVPGPAGEPQECQPTLPTDHLTSRQNGKHHHPHKRHRHQANHDHHHHSSHPNASGSHD